MSGVLLNYWSNGIHDVTYQNIVDNLKKIKKDSLFNIFLKYKILFYNCQEGKIAIYVKSKKKITRLPVYLVEQNTRVSCSTCVKKY
jgi:hypothetical protein